MRRDGNQPKRSVNKTCDDNLKVLVWIVRGASLLLLMVEKVPWWTSRSCYQPMKVSLGVVPSVGERRRRAACHEIVRLSSRGLDRGDEIAHRRFVWGHHIARRRGFGTGRSIMWINQLTSILHMTVIFKQCLERRIQTLQPTSSTWPIWEIKTLSEEHNAGLVLRWQESCCRRFRFCLSPVHTRYAGMRTPH